jgi:hypothetical protein
MTDRRAFIAGLALTPAAIATPALAQEADRRLAWEDALHEWKRACALRDAFYEIGPMEWANNQWGWDQRALEGKYGSLEKARLHPQGKLEYDRAWNASRNVEAVQDQYYEPADDAAWRLLRTPAPDVDAVRIKLDAVKKHELHLHNDRGGEPWRIIERELRAFAERG